MRPGAVARGARARMTLSQEEYEECRIAFNKFDQDGSGKIDVPELRATLQALGQHPTDEELFLMISSGAWRAHQGSRATASVAARRASGNRAGAPLER